MAVSVLLPFTPTDPHRARALAHVIRHYRGWQTVIGTTEGPWCKARAVADALEHATGDILVIADADCICAGTPGAVQAIIHGAPWAMPHKRVHRLTEDATSDILRGAEPHRHQPTTQPPYVGVPGGGIVVLTRATYEQAPLDPRFTGWGQEDESWALALETLAGTPWRGRTDLFHLYHPPQERASRRIGSEASKLLHRRYHAAHGDPETMAELIDEGRNFLTPEGVAYT